MIDQNALVLGASIVSSRAKEQIKEDMSLEDKAKLCYKLAFDDSNTWFANKNDDDAMFRIGTGALLTLTEEGSEERERINASMGALKALNAAVSGVMVDWDSELKKMNGVEPFPLMDIYKKTKKEVLG